MYRKSSKDFSEQCPAPNRLKIKMALCNFDQYYIKGVNKQLMNLLWKHDDTSKEGNLD